MSDTNELHKMTPEELGELFPIIILDYSDKWIKLYQAERELIIDLFTKSEILSIEHIGSTAIPRLKDIQKHIDQVMNEQNKRSISEFEYYSPFENVLDRLTFDDKELNLITKRLDETKKKKYFFVELLKKK